MKTTEGPNAGSLERMVRRLPTGLPLVQYSLLACWICVIMNSVGNIRIATKISKVQSALQSLQVQSRSVSPTQSTSGVRVAEPPAQLPQRRSASMPSHHPQTHGAAWAVELARLELACGSWGISPPNSKLSDGGTEDQSTTEEATRRSLKRSVSP